MRFQEIYDQPDAAIVEAFVRSQATCTLVTRTEQGRAHAGITNPVFEGPHAFVHLHRDDEQVSDLRAAGSALLVFQDVLSVIPSHWVDPAYGGAATTYYRYAELECSPLLIEEPSEMKRVLQGLLDRFQPEGGYEPLDPEAPIYAASFRALVVARLTPTKARSKWKLGQNRPEEVRARVAHRLRARGEGNDARAAAEVERWLGADATD